METENYDSNKQASRLAEPITTRSSSFGGDGILDAGSRVVAEHCESPRLNIQNKKAEPYCQKIIAVCSQADEGCLNAFEEAIKALNEVGLGGTRDDIRSQAYTLKILAYKNYR